MEIYEVRYQFSKTKHIHVPVVLLSHSIKETNVCLSLTA